MAAALFLILLLVASGGAAVVVGDDGDAATLPHLQLRGTADSGREHASDAPPQAGLMDYLNSTHGCGGFAALVARTASAAEIFRDHVVGGLTVFCPDDLALASFEAKFANLTADDQLAVLLHHAAAARYGREQIAAFESVEVRSLAADAATNKSLALTVRDDGDTVSVWPSSGSYGAAARVTKAAISSDDSPLAVYVVDAMLLPIHLRQLLDGAAPCTPCGGGGYLGWLHCPISVRPVWLCWAVSGMVCILAGFFVTDYHHSRRQNEAIRRLMKAISSGDSPLAIDADDVELLPTHLRVLLDVYLRVRAECL